MDDKAIEAAARAYNAFCWIDDWDQETASVQHNRIEQMRAAIAAYEAALGPINPGPIADMVNENVRLRAQVERMREALRPFANVAESISDLDMRDYTDDEIVVSKFGDVSDFTLQLADFRAARAAMEG